MIRKPVGEHFGKGKRSLASEDRKRAALSLIGLGKSGLADVSERVDDYLGRAIYGEMAQERRVPYKRRRYGPKKQRSFTCRP